MGLPGATVLRINEIIGVIEVDKVQNDFITVLRSQQKLNRVLTVNEHLITHEGNTLLVFHVPEASRTEKPIYLNGDIRQTFIRKGGCDVRCSEDELKRIIADASTERYDCQCVELNPEHFMGEYRFLLLGCSSSGNLLVISILREVIESG